MNFNASELKLKAEKAKPSTDLFFKKIYKRIPANFDEVVHELHTEVFEEVNCLECGNCCKSLGPRITDKDIEKLAKYLKVKPSDFVKKYLKIDEDNDYVFQTMPCPFLGTDNYCFVYSERPKACREYPHTDRRKFHQLLAITLKNTSTCPAVFQIVEKLKLRRDLF
jgi:Fe-S-cluster containining protein